MGRSQANIHRALGSIGAVGTAAARDLREVRELGFAVFTPQVVLGRGHMHMLDFGGPVDIGGVTVATGELVQADAHGVQTVPPAALGALEAACERLATNEREIIEFCRSPRFSIEGLRALRRG